MQPSTRQKELEALYEKRRKGHVPQISITDDNHHVTEAIGSYYDDEPSMSPVNGIDSRPLSFVSSPDESYQSKEAKRAKRNGSYFDQRIPLARTGSNEKVPTSTDGAIGSPKSKSPGSFGSENGNGGAPVSPPQLSRQSSTDTAIQQFPLNDIDYESSPAAVAQELSNLQAIRRMSMNVDTADPDLPSFAAPNVAPKGSGDENDTARLFWVPARLHPELAPKEFKTFIEERVDKIKRRSGDADSLLSDGPERTGSNSSLRRKKSMLSRQIDTGINYEDGAERLERKKSKGMSIEGQMPVELAELESLVNDPAQMIRRLSLDTAVRRSSDSGIEVSPGEDMPVPLPGGQSLKRSTRTAYRRGSLKKGERVPFSRRAQQRHTDPEAEDLSAQSPITPASDEPIMGLTRVQTEPTPPPSSSSTRSAHPSRPDAGTRRREAQATPPLTEQPSIQVTEDEKTERRPSQGSLSEDEQPPPRPQHRQFQSRLASGHGRTTAQLPGYDNQNPLPQIIETLPDGTKVPKQTLLQSAPDRKSAHDPRRDDPPRRGGAHMRPALTREQQQQAPQRSATLDDISSRPSPLPGSGNTSTGALTMVPTFDDSRKTEKKDGARKSSWKWILGNDEDKAPKEDKGSDSGSVKSGKGVKLTKPAADRARLDVLQTSIDGNAQAPARGRESLVLNRDDVKLDEERKKESKKSSEPRKEKEKDGLLSAIFGGKKKNSDGDVKEKKRKSDRGASPEPPPRILKPDIDYNWTRFSILEERAIYRMAHIKLANPRRALYSQVLLSNFMYSYLAKVQMMHPQVQIPPAHQKAQQRGSKQQEDQQQNQQQQQQQQQQRPEEYNQYQRWQQQQQEREQAEAANANAGNRTSLEIISPGGPVQQRTTYDSYDDDSSASGYDTRSSEDYVEYEHSYQQPAHQSVGQQSRINGVGSGRRRSGGGAYSVAQTHDYLGYPKDQQPFDSRGMGLWDDERENREEVW